MGREDAPRPLRRKDGFTFLSSLRPAEAAGAHRPGPRAPSRWWPSGKFIIAQAPKSEFLTGPLISSIIFLHSMGNEKKILLMVHVMEALEQDFFMPAYLGYAYDG